MRRPHATRRGQRLPQVRLSDLPPAPPRARGERPRTFAPLPPPICIWALPNPELAPTAHLRRILAPRPSLGWRIARGALLFLCAFGLTCLTLLAATWLEQPATQTTANPAAPALQRQLQ